MLSFVENSSRRYNNLLALQQSGALGRNVRIEHDENCEDAIFRFRWLDTGLVVEYNVNSGLAEFRSSVGIENKSYDLLVRVSALADGIGRSGIPVTIVKGGVL